MNKVYQHKFQNYDFPEEFCVFKDVEKGVLLYQIDCLKLMDILIKNILKEFLI